jgi:type IV secretory pathway component VirB8
MQPTNAESIAVEIENGEYFRESRRWYSEIFHTPIAQRSYYVLVILLAMINMYFANVSFSRVFPITVSVPFITYSNNIWEEIPHIRRITSDELEDKNAAVMKFLIASYVDNRESYDLPLFELRYRNIWSQSTKNVFEEYKKQIDASNPYSFYRLYTNRARRYVEVQSLDWGRANNTMQAHVIFEAYIILLADGSELSHSKWRADITYKYTDFRVDQSLDTRNAIARFFGLTGDSLKASGEKRKIVPMTFIVSDYKVKELLE